MQPSSLTQLCRTVGDPYLVLEAVKRGVLPDADTLGVACQRVAQVSKACQHIMRCHNRSEDIRLPQRVFVDGMYCYHALWELVVDKLIAMGATIDADAIQSLEQSGLQEMAQKVSRVYAPAKRGKTP